MKSGREGENELATDAHRITQIGIWLGSVFVLPGH